MFFTSMAIMKIEQNRIEVVFLSVILVGSHLVIMFFHRKMLHRYNTKVFIGVAN